MTRRRLLLAFALTFTCAPTGGPAGPDEPLSRFESIPRRPLRGADFEISVAVPRGDDIEGDLARRKLDLHERGDLAAFKDAVGQLSRLAERQHEFEESHPERVLPFLPPICTSPNGMCSQRAAHSRPINASVLNSWRKCSDWPRSTTYSERAK